MSWYVLQCRTGREGEIIRSCRQHISADALKEVFSFRCERLWRTDGVWKLVEKEMFPGYVFLESSRPDKLSEELEAYRKKQIEEAVQYPMNMTKLEASQVITHGDYVFFVMLGGADMEAEEQGADAALKSAKENNQIAVDVIAGFFK